MIYLISKRKTTHNDYMHVEHLTKLNRFGSIFLKKKKKKRKKRHFIIKEIFDKLIHGIYTIINVASDSL